MKYRFHIFVLCSLLGALLPIGAIAQKAQVTVRGADHPGFSRVVFDFSAPTEYSVNRNGDRVELRISPAFEPEFMIGSALSRISGEEVTQDSQSTVVSFSVDTALKLRHFKDGIALVIDAVDPNFAATESSEAEITSLAQAGSQPVPAQDNSSDLASDDAAPDLTESVSTSENAPSPEPGAVVSAPAGRKVLVRSDVTAEGYQFAFDWDVAANAAAFTRAGVLWVVFDRPAQFDLTQATAEMGRRLTSVQQTAGDDYSVVRIGLADDFGVAAASSGNIWTVTLSESRREPDTPVAVTRQDTESDGFRIFMPYDRPGSHLRLADPIIGDVLDVVPLSNAGTGLGISRMFAEFEVLQTAQGIVVAPMSDRVIVNRYANGVAVGAMSNLAVSAPNLPRRFGEVPTPAADSFTPTRLIDFATWRQGGTEDYVAVRQKLEHEISVADGEERNARRWDYARFMLAHGFGHEAVAILRLMRDQNPDIVHNPAFRAVAGLADISIRDFDVAAEDLSLPELDAEPEIWLWRGRAAEGQGHDLTALNYFDRGRDAFAVVTPERLGELQLSALRAAVAVSNSGDAQLYLNWLTKTSLTPAQAAEATYLEGRFLEQKGQRANALDRYARVDATANPKIAALARQTRLVSDLANNEIGRDAAIDELEELRYVWRGDEVERAVLKTLGQLYLEDRQYREGLETLRQLVTMTPDEEEGRKVTERMSAAFRELFLDGEADRLPEVTALALYYDFRELTPLGQEGDQMIRRLSERLVSVDLLDHAADLLDHQVRFRLEGAAQAIVATRLAKIHMLNKKPEEALDILRLTRQTDLPEDVLRERKLVEARVLTELGRYEEADVLVSDMSGGDVDSLRPDIYWGWRSWGRLANATAKLLAERGDSRAPLSDVERQTLLRHAIAISMQGDSQALSELRRRYGDVMQHGRFANAFDIITASDRNSSDEIRDVVRQTAAVANLQSFMSEYRAEFVNPPAGGAVPSGGS